MAKRLTEKQKEEIVKSFKEGNNLDSLSKAFNCNKLTIIRNLKKSLGENDYKKFHSKSSSLEVTSNKVEDEFKNDLRLESHTNIANDDFENGIDIKDNFIETGFNHASSFLEIAPLDCEIDNVPQKDLSSIPICEIDLPKTVYMVVDKNIELETKSLKDYPKWDFLSKNELERKTIEIHNDLKIAKSSCNKDQKVIKIPNSNVFKIVAPILLSKGISRIVCSDNLISL